MTRNRFSMCKESEKKNDINQNVRLGKCVTMGEEEVTRVLKQQRHTPIRHLASNGTPASKVARKRGNLVFPQISPMGRRPYLLVEHTNHSRVCWGRQQPGTTKSDPIPRILVLVARAWSILQPTNPYQALVIFRQLSFNRRPSPLGR